MRMRMVRSFTIQQRERGFPIGGGNQKPHELEREFPMGRGSEVSRAREFPSGRGSELSRARAGFP
eukprot:6847445-Karenia_brevis.AAC.1